VTFPRTIDWCACTPTWPAPNGERQKLRQLDLLESIENPVWLQRFLDLFAAKDQIEKVLSMPPVRGI
jgi:hypothetical protein